MSNNIIDGALNYLGNLKTVADVAYLTGTQVTGITIPANSGVNLTTKGVEVVPAPTGYTRLLWGVITSGSSATVAVSMNSYWVQNTGASSQTISATPWSLFVKKN